MAALGIADVIAGAIVAYLLMAVMWTQIYVVSETAQPGLFNFSAGARDSIQTLLRYFSLVTVTTVGYGDITAVSPAARAFANLESVVGQLYLVIRVAWLVGMHVSIFPTIFRPLELIRQDRTKVLFQNLPTSAI